VLFTYVDDAIALSQRLFKRRAAAPAAVVAKEGQA
jgi:hypothetical protein